MKSMLSEGEIVLRRCCGFTHNFRRCGRKGDWKLFCEDHRLQPIGWVIFLVFTVAAGMASIYSAWNKSQTQISQRLPSAPEGTTGSGTLPNPTDNKPFVLPAPPREPPREAEQPTLTTLFKSDFPTVVKAAVDGTVTCPNKKERAIKRQVYLDFDAKVDYIGFLILGSGNRTDSGETFQICRLLSGQVQDTLDIVKNRTIATDLSFGQRTASAELAFSGRVFIYHEDFLSLEERAELIRIYRDKGCSVEFRGPDYLAIKLIAWTHEPWSGNAITRGDQSPAVTGDGNSITYDNPSSSQEPKPKQQK